MNVQLCTHQPALAVLASLLLMFTAGRGLATAQVDHESIRVGVTGSATMNMHRGTLTTQDGLIECGEFTDANTIGWMLGNSVWIPVTSSWSLTGKLQYWKADGVFTQPNPVQPNVALPSGDLVRMTSEYQVATMLDYITLDALALWYPTPSLFVGLGPTLGLNTRANFEQTETIQQPTFLEFTNGGRERTFLASSFETNGVSANIRLALTALIGYDIPVSEKLIVTPEVGFSYGITTVLSSSPSGAQNDWRVHAPRAGVTIAYVFSSDPEPAPAPVVDEAPPAPPPAVAAAPVRSSSIELLSEFSSGATAQGADVVLTELTQSDVIPILPFVFFATNDASIPTRYHVHRGGSFQEEALSDSVIGIYHEILNIVGSRMKTYPGATLSLTGYREPRDGEERAALGTDRATAVRAYLQSTWGIDPARITVAGGELPPVVSNRTVTDGREENRRVELRSNDPRILAPVHIRSVERSVEPPHVQLVTSASDAQDVQSRTATVSLGEQRVAGMTAASSADEMRWTVDPDVIASTLGSAVVMTGHVELHTTWSDGTNHTALAGASARKMVQSRRFSNDVVNDSLVERFRLIFFDFDKAEVNDFNKPMIDLVRSRVRTNSALHIKGLTDRIGPKDHNENLSLRRAQETERVIKERVIPNVSTAEGVGPELIFNNDLPEGRWYNRTVLIEVATPVDRP